MQRHKDVLMRPQCVHPRPVELHAVGEASAKTTRKGAFFSNLGCATAFPNRPRHDHRALDLS